MAYIYRHIRLDKNVPFYIGIGNDNRGKYTRAYIKSNRSIIWKRIVSKTEYEVEILMDGISWEEACDKEKEFIKLYGRADMGKGPLANLTDGGDGVVNGITTETRNKMAARLRGRKLPTWQREILSRAAMGKSVHWCHRPILQFDLSGNFIKEFKCVSDAKKETKIRNICKVLANNRAHAGGFIFVYKEDEHKLPELISNMPSKLGGSLSRKKVINLSNNIVYPSLKEAAEKEGIVYSTLKAAFSQKGQYKQLTYA